MNATIEQEEFSRLYRRYLAANVLFHQAAAEHVGLGAIDYQASNVLDLDGPLASGELARRLGLTGGATTRLVDRLVRAGMARRVADPADRRRTLVEHSGRLPDGLAAALDAVRGPIRATLEQLTEDQLDGLQAYFRAASETYSEAARTLREPTGEAR